MTPTAPIWGFRESAGYHDGADLTGYAVEATDGMIGKVIYAGRSEAAGTYLVVDTGRWIFGKLVVLPAGAVALVDRKRETVFVDRTRQEVREAPEFAELIQPPQPDYFAALGDYYGAYYGRYGL